MDRHIAGFPFKRDRDLRLCEAHGIAYQDDMNMAPVAYDDAYFDKYVAYERTDIAARLNSGRCAMLARHAIPGLSRVLDIGAGCGTFVKFARASGYPAFGFDVMEKSIANLRSMDAFADDPSQFHIVTFWDSLEHIPDPGSVLDKVSVGAVLLVAIPIFTDLHRVRESKHYRPGEHLYYMSPQGFVSWMGLYGYRLLEESNHEVEAGRESIGAFAFVRETAGVVP